MADPANDWMVSAPGAQDYAEVYRSTRDTLRATTVVTMLGTPGFERFAATLGAEPPEVAYARHWVSIEAALEGDWSRHAAALRVTGARCAALGVSLDDWRLLMDRTSVVVRDALFARFGAEPVRLKDTMALMQRFYDTAFGVFIEAYVSATQEELRESETFFRLSPIGQMVVSNVGSISKANDAFLTMYGIPRAELGTLHLRALYEPNELKRVLRDVYRTAHAAGQASFDSIHVRADGTTFPVRVEAVRISGQNAWGHSIYDLTERMQAASWQARSVELEAENVRVRDATRSKSEFLANMSHELRTPLNAILGFSQLLEAGEVGPLEAQQLEFVRDIRASGQHLLQLINDVLDLAKVEAGKLEFQPEPLDLPTVTREAVQLIRLSAAQRAVRVEVTVDERVCAAALDRVRYLQVLYNYLSNAIKFSPNGGRVSVVLAPSGTDAFRLSVSDEGPGIAVEHHGRLFVLFGQLGESRAKHHAGTGLGLALTKQLVEAQGGRVGIDSVPGNGCTFYAILPVRPPP